MGDKVIKKFKNWIIGLFSALGAFFVLLSIFRKKKLKDIKEVKENEKIIITIKSDLDNLKKVKSEVKKKVEKLEKTADGRSQKVKTAKKEVLKVDRTIKALEDELKSKEKLLGL